MYSNGEKMNDKKKFSILDFYFEVCNAILEHEDRLDKLEKKGEENE